MKITRSKLRRIIKEEVAKISEALPPHLQRDVDRYEAKKKRFSITDVTPRGYGPFDPEEEIEKIEADIGQLGAADKAYLMTSATPEEFDKRVEEMREPPEEEVGY